LNRNARILIACEESGIVTGEFIKLGYENVWSCDIGPTSGNHPERHLQQDVIPLLKQQWDMLIAFPPCTYLSNAGNRWLWQGGQLNQQRYEKGMVAKDFFLKILNTDCPRIAIENPLHARIYNMPPHSQEIQPWQFGHPVTKKNTLMAKGITTIDIHGYCGTDTLLFTQ